MRSRAVDGPAPVESCQSPSVRKGHTHARPVPRAGGSLLARIQVRRAAPHPKPVDRSKQSMPASASAVNLAHLAVSPLYRVLGGHALYGLRVHVDDDVFGKHFGGLCSGRSGMAIDTAEPRRDAIRGHDRILAPHLMVFPLLSGTGGKSLLHVEPFVINFGRVEPLQELHRLLLILRIAHHHHALEGVNTELAGGSSR